MNHNPETNPYIGRTKAALVIESGNGPTALVTQVIAKAIFRDTTKQVSFSGPVKFSSKTKRHIETVVWSLAQSILSQLNIRCSGFEISVANLGLSSIQNRGIMISGFSLDFSVFLSILSAGLKVPVRNNTVFTGHIASIDGTVSMVKSLPSKIEAAVKNPEIDYFVYPTIDASIHELAPQTKAQIEGALAQSKNDLRYAAIMDIGDLVHYAFAETHVVRASLKNDYFGKNLFQSETISGTTKAISCLARDLEQRFWHVLRAHLLQGQSTEASRLLLNHLDYHLGIEIYPQNAGKRLYQTLAAVPPFTRQYTLKFPLCPIMTCIQLGLYAKESDSDDFLFLLKACSGENIRSPKNVIDKSEQPRETQDDPILGTILSEIDVDNLCVKISHPIDNARSSFLMESVTADSYEVFNEVISSYFIHLLNHTRQIIDPIEVEVVRSEATALLERAFSSKGGLGAAWAEARDATQGGLRFVLDSMTDQFKREENEKYVGYVLKSAMDPLDWERKVEIVRNLISRLQNYLPPEIKSNPPERYASNFNEIVKVYVNSIDQFKSYIRTI